MFRRVKHLSIPNHSRLMIWIKVMTTCSVKTAIAFFSSLTKWNARLNSANEPSMSSIRRKPAG